MAEENHLGSALEEKEPAPAGRASDRLSRRVLLRQHSRTRLRTALLILIPLFVVAGSILLWRYFASYESTDDAQVDVHLYPVSARVSGYVVKVNVTDNQYVQQGAVGWSRLIPETTKWPWTRRAPISPMRKRPRDR